MHHEVIQKTLAHRAGRAPDAHSVAEATIGTWEQVTKRLIPVIGARGVDALFSRSLHITSKTYPWLASSGNDANTATRLITLRAQLMDHEPENATAASCKLLLTFTTLLASLIGTPLTDRLLTPAWSPPEQAAEQESES